MFLYAENIGVLTFKNITRFHIVSTLKFKYTTDKEIAFRDSKSYFLG